MTFRLMIAAAAILVALPAYAQEYRKGDIAIENPWARATAGRAANGAGFMKLVNSGSTDDRLIKAETGVAKKTELHTHMMEGDVMKMRPVPAIDLPAGQSVMLKPGGLHVMMMGLHDPLKQGESFPVTLTFEKAGTVTVDVPIQSVGAKSSGHMGGHGDMKKHGHGDMKKKSE